MSLRPFLENLDAARIERAGQRNTNDRFATASEAADELDFAADENRTGRQGGAID